MYSIYIDDTNFMNHGELLIAQAPISLPSLRKSVLSFLFDLFLRAAFAKSF